MSVPADADPPEVDAENGDGRLSDVELRAIVALGAYRAYYWMPAPVEWLTSRMPWSDGEAERELSRLRARGLVVGGDGELLATSEGVALALSTLRRARIEKARRSRPSS